MLVLQWQEWTPGEQPRGLQLAEFVAPMYFDASNSKPSPGPSMLVTKVPGWNAALGAHCQAADDHIKFIGVALAIAKEHFGQ